MLAVCPPVGRYHSLKVPLTAQNTGQKILVFRCLNAVDQVVGRHDCVWICLFYDDLEGFQVNLTQRTLGNAGVAVFPVGLLVVAGKMFHSGADLLRLDA